MYCVYLLDGVLCVHSLDGVLAPGVHLLDGVMCLHLFMVFCLHTYFMVNYVNTYLIVFCVYSVHLLEAQLHIV